MEEEHTAGAGFPLDPEEFRRLGHRAIDLAADYLSTVEQRPVFTPTTGQEREALAAQPLPEQGIAVDALLDRVAGQVFTHPMGNGNPRFFGWVNSPPDPTGILAELLAATLNPSCAGGDHAAVYLERGVLRWLMQLVGFPIEGSRGLLVSGGSMASLTCLAAARQWGMAKLGTNVRVGGLQHPGPRLRLYLTAEGHSCVHKAVELLGLGSAALHPVATDADLRMDVEALRAAIVADRAAGDIPWCVVASAGTVNSGAIDPLATIADLCASEQLWLHVDGAYGAVGILDPLKAPLYTGMERADSLALDPHKWLSVPIECGCALVRDGALLRDTFSLVPPYLRTVEGRGFGGPVWFSEYGFQQTRNFRALKLWMVIAATGRQGLVARISRHNALAQRLAQRINEAQDLELLAPVTLSIVCFRYRPAQPADLEALNRLNEAVVHEVQAHGEAFVTGTTIHGIQAIRACILHFHTNEDDLERLLHAVRSAARQVLEGSDA